MGEENRPPRRTRKPAPPKNVWCLFDTETTGLIKNSLVPLNQQPQVIEFYGVQINDAGEKLHEIDMLIDPQKPLEAIITKITGLRDADLRGKPKFVDVASVIRSFIEGSTAVVAHSLKFDMGMLNLEYRRLDQTLRWPMGRVCTVEATEHLKGFRFSLSKLYRHLFDEDFPEAHRARNDVAALKRCFLELRKMEVI